MMIRLGLDTFSAIITIKHPKWSVIDRKNEAKILKINYTLMNKIVIHRIVIQIV